VIPYLKD